jgi:hypothetical protein
VSDDPNKTRDVLRGASDGLLIAIREVDARERIKRAVLPGDPDFPGLARAVRIAAETVLKLARQEEVAAEGASRTAVGAQLPTINESKPPRDLASILDEWRAVERRLEAATPASAEAEQLMEAFQALRTQYAEALEALRRKG